MANGIMIITAAMANNTNHHTMDKEFLTYNQQMKCLRKKGIACGGTSDKTVLCRTGYFNLVNGYKTPFVSFVDVQTRVKTYFPGTSLASIKAVYDFDESLRSLLFPCLTKVENEVRAFASYKFDAVNSPDGNTWFDVKSYDPSKKSSEIVRTISRAYSEISRAKNGSYVEFYLNNHDSIPTWVLTKFIKFETFINFLVISKPVIKDDICCLYDIKDNQGRPWHKLLINMLYWIKQFRNASAHNGRLYTQLNENSRLEEKYLHLLPVSYKRDRGQRFLDLLLYLKYFMEPNDYEALLDLFTSYMNTLCGLIDAAAFERVRASLGLKAIGDIDLLKQDANYKNYNAF